MQVVMDYLQKQLLCSIEKILKQLWEFIQEEKTGKISYFIYLFNL